MSKQPTKQLVAVVFKWQYDALRVMADERGCSVSDVVRDKLADLRIPPKSRKTS